MNQPELLTATLVHEEESKATTDQAPARSCVGPLTHAPPALARVIQPSDGFHRRYKYGVELAR